MACALAVAADVPLVTREPGEHPALQLRSAAQFSRKDVPECSALWASPTMPGVAVAKVHRHAVHVHALPVGVAQRAVAHEGRLTLAARFSRKARTRSLAASSPWAMLDIRLSTNRPSAAGRSAMRGSACVMA